MKLLSFNKNTKENVGLKTESGVIDLPESYFNKYHENPPRYFYSLREFFENFEVAREQTIELLQDESSIIKMPVQI